MISSVKNIKEGQRNKKLKEVSTLDMMVRQSLSDKVTFATWMMKQFGRSAFLKENSKEGVACFGCPRRSKAFGVGVGTAWYVSNMTLGCMNWDLPGEAMRSMVTCSKLFTVWGEISGNWEQKREIICLIYKTKTNVQNWVYVIRL